MKEIKAPPKQKVHVVRDEQTAEELEKLLTDGYRLAQVTPLKELAIYVLVKG